MPYVGQKPADIISTAVDTVTGTFSGEVDAASLDISGNIDVDGTTNLDVVDIDGAVDMASTALVTGVLTANGGAVFNEASADVDFRVESNGNANMLFVDGGNDKVGIGTNIPSRVISAKSSSVTVGNFESTSSTAGFVSFSDANTTNDVTVRIGAVGDNLVLQSGGAERMRIASSGNVGIGEVPVSGVTFAVKSLTNIHPARFTITTAATGVLVDQLATSGTRVFHDFRINNVVKGKIQSTDGTNTIYATTSDYRLKENVVTEWDATTRLKQLKPSRFNFIENPNNTVDGFLAHEVSAIVPEAISGTKDAVDADGKPDYQFIDQSKLVPLLVKTIQELEARITALENGE